MENDDRLFNFKDCLDIHALTGIPIVFDTFHHRLLNNGESLPEAIQNTSCTWDKRHDGILMVDYSDQEGGERLGVHSYEINIESFRHFLRCIKEFDFDLLLEIKNKEKSALQAKSVIDSLFQKDRAYCA